MHAYLQNHLKTGLDVICIVSDHWSLRIRTLSYIIIISLSHLKVNSDATLSITHGGFQAHKLFVPLWKVKFNLPPLVGWMKWLTSSDWNMSEVVESQLWRLRKRCGFCLRYTLLNSLESLLLREARCYMDGALSSQLHGPGAQERGGLSPTMWVRLEVNPHSAESWDDSSPGQQFDYSLMRDLESETSNPSQSQISGP